MANIEYPDIASLSVPLAPSETIAYDATLEAWAQEQYAQAASPLERLEALAEMSIPTAWETIARSGGEAIRHLAEKAQLTPNASAQEVWQDTLYASILDSPLADVHRLVTDNVAPEVVPYLPSLLVEEAQPDVDLGSGVLAARVVPEGYRTLQAAYDLSCEQLAKKGVADEVTIKATTCSLLEHAAAWKPQPGEFQDALGWMQLGSQVKQALLIIREKHKIPIDPQQFIGKSQDAQSATMYHHLRETYMQYEPKDRAPKVRALVEQMLEMAKKDPLEPHAQKRTEQFTDVLGTDDSLNAWMEALYTGVKSQFFEESSLAHKAIFLNEWMQVYRRGEDESRALPPVVPWLQKAPPDLIERTFQKLTGLPTAEEHNTVERTALLEYVFGQDVKLDDDLLEACSTMSPFVLKPITEIRDFVAAQHLSITPKETVKLANSVHYEPRKLKELFGMGYSLKDIIKTPWLASVIPFGMVEENYPVEGPRNSKHRWLCDTSIEYMRGGWNRATVGRILAAGLDADPTQASQVSGSALGPFQIPEKYGGNRMHDVALEESYLANMLRLPANERERIEFPTNPRRIDYLFWQPENQYAYKALLELFDSEDDCSVDQLRNIIMANREAYFDELSSKDNPLTTARMVRGDFYAGLEKILAELQLSAGMLPEQPPAAHDMRTMLGTLKAYSARRTAYTHGTSAWLLTHADNPSWQNIVAWDFRPQALAAGVKDNAGDILRWAQLHQVEVVFGDTGKHDGQPSNAEIRKDYQPWIDELLRYYDAEMTLDAIRACALPQKDGLSEPMLPAITTELQLEPGNKNTYSAMILAKDDPRGLTLGADTGCCMRWTTTGAKECIRAGYTLPNAGFFALASQDGRIVAQSFFFVPADKPDTLVLDSIEANAGRDPAKVLHLYQDFWQQYLAKRSQEDPAWQVRNVQVGTAYSRIDYNSLPVASEAPLDANTPYTDAKEQRVLLNLTNQELDQPTTVTWQSGERKIRKPPVHLATVVNKEALITSMETTIFPPEFQTYNDIEALIDVLDKKEAYTYSLVAQKSPQDTEDPIGYCIAYLEKDVAVSDDSKDTLVIDSFAVMPGHGGAALQMFKEVLARAQDADIQTIRFAARESTSYRLATSESLRKRVSQWGYAVINAGTVDESSEGEKLYDIRLQRNTNALAV